MKYIFLGALAALLLSGCGTKNAFSKLKLKPNQEKAIENTRSAKMLSGQTVGGVFSAIYLNNIYGSDEKRINFYVSIYLKDENEPLRFTLNKQERVLEVEEKPFTLEERRTPELKEQEALEVQELPNENQYAELLTVKNKWSKNYLVSFEELEGETLSLWIDNGQFSSGPLKYSRDAR